MKSYILCFFLMLSTCLPAQGSDYLIGDGDVLKITVYEHDDLTSTVRVSGDGAIVMPLIGEVSVAGMAIGKIAQKITELLADGYIINPQVNIFVDQFRSQKAIILGQISKPGLYELSGVTSLLELISKAGGLTQEAGLSAILRRKISQEKQQEKIIRIHLDDLVEKGDLTQNIEILDGDNIFISKAGLFYITGEVKKPDAYKCSADTTVIKAISLAGGYTGKAAKNKVKIIRKIDNDEQILEEVSMAQQVMPEDVIVVPESFF